MRKQGGTGAVPEFAKLLEQYGLTPEDVEQEELVVPCRSVITLSASPRHASYRRPRMLQTNDLDVLKRWIGVPDAAVKGRCLVDREHRTAFEQAGRALAASEVGQPVKEPAAVSVRMEALRAHARAYLYGDSSLVAKAKPTLEAQIGVAMIPVWAYPKVKVSSGSVLLFGPGANVLVASEVEIERGGQIICTQGSLTVRVWTLRKTEPVFTHPELALDHVLKFVRT